MPSPDHDATDAPIGAPHLFALFVFSAMAVFILRPDGTVYTYAALSVAGLLLVFLPFVSGIVVVDWLWRE